MFPFVLGIDIAKKTFDVALITADNRPKPRHFSNEEAGFTALIEWLKTQFVEDLSQLHVGLEATGRYGDALARFLLGKGCRVSLLNPAVTRAFARTELTRTRTDKADAARIARYVRLHEPVAWTPPEEHREELQDLVRHLDRLKTMRTMVSNQQESASPVIVDSLSTLLKTMDEQIETIEKRIQDHIDKHPDLWEQRELLESIGGIGKKTAAVLLAELGPIERFSSAKKAASFAGLAPRIHESGTSVRSRTVMSKMGSSLLRKALYFPAMSALRSNAVIQAMASRLKATGHCPMSIIGAAMRRLVHLAYGVLKSKKRFDPKIAMAAYGCPQTAAAIP